MSEKNALLHAKTRCDIVERKYGDELVGMIDEFEKRLVKIISRHNSCRVQSEFDTAEKKEIYRRLLKINNHE